MLENHLTSLRGFFGAVLLLFQFRLFSRIKAILSSLPLQGPHGISAGLLFSCARSMWHPVCTANSRIRLTQSLRVTAADGIPAAVGQHLDPGRRHAGPGKGDQTRGGDAALQAHVCVLNVRRRTMQTGPRGNKVVLTTEFHELGKDSRPHL